MKAMILAAGRGERMRPLTDELPKPLLRVKGCSLIEYHLQALAKAGFSEVIINHAWLGEKIIAQLGTGERWQLTIRYSDESDGAIETAGGIAKALPLIQNNQADDNEFLVVNGDVFTDFSFLHLPRLPQAIKAHLWLVENPAHNLKGDFAINHGMIDLSGRKKLTFSGIGLYRPSFFDGISQEYATPLAPLIRDFSNKVMVSASKFCGRWTDVGTPERLQQLNEE